MAIKLKIGTIITDRDLKIYKQSDYDKIYKVVLKFKEKYKNINNNFYNSLDNDLDYNYFENRANEIIENNSNLILEIIDDNIKKNIFRTEMLFNDSEKFITTINNYKIPKERIDNSLNIIQAIKLIKKIDSSAKIKHNENLYDDVILLCKHYNISNANLIINKLFLLRHFEKEYFNKIKEKPLLKIKK